jgi:hypothetical protein
VTDVPPFVVPDILVDLATTILAVCGAALDDNGVTGFGYRVIAPGIEQAVDFLPVPGSLSIVINTLHAGKIGEQQFSGLVPGAAAWADSVAVFKVQLWAGNAPQPGSSSIAGFRAPTAAALTAYAISLLKAGYICWAAMQQGQFQNALFPHKPALIGPLTPLGPQGGPAGMELMVQIQLP